MAEALKQHAIDNDVKKVEERPPFGVHYVIEGPSLRQMLEIPMSA